MSKCLEINCLLCKITGYGAIVNDKLRDDCSGQHKIYRCLTCGHVQMFPLPTQDDDEVFYNNDIQHKNLMGKIDFEVSRSKASSDTSRRVELIKNMLPNNIDEGQSVLDIGCGYGFFVDQLTKQGINAVGIDVSHIKVALAVEKCAGAFEHGKLNPDFISKNLKKYSIVTLFHVLEHLHEPECFIKSCMMLLKEGGILLIEVPNFGDELLHYSAKYREFYFQRAHLSYFDPPRLELLIRRAGYEGFTIRGLQRYGLRNIMHWIDEAEPQLSNPDYSEQDELIAQYESIVNTKREELLTSDTVMVEIVNYST
jgi:SAM-dependent methyltransferase